MLFELYYIISSTYHLEILRQVIMIIMELCRSGFFLSFNLHLDLLSLF